MDKDTFLCTKLQRYLIDLRDKFKYPLWIHTGLNKQVPFIAITVYDNLYTFSR